MKYEVSGNTDLYEYLVAHSCRPNEHLEGLHKVRMYTFNALSMIASPSMGWFGSMILKRSAKPFLHSSLREVLARKCCGET